MDITKQRLKDLEDCEAKLGALEMGGVDNWEWYGESLKGYFKEKELAEGMEDLVEEICEIANEGINEPAGRGCGFGLSEQFEDSIEKAIRLYISKLKEDE